jgi:uroporphyrin-3 C-methyltransferase
VSEQDKKTGTTAEQAASQVPEKPETKASAAQKPNKPRKRGALRILSLLLFLVLIAAAAAGYYGYNFYREFNSRLQALSLQQTKTENANAELKAQLGESLQSMSRQQAELANEIQILQRRSHFVRKDWLIMEAEYLLQLANYRLLFERDTRTAMVALKSADERLRETGDPGLISVRKAIAESEQALAEVPQPDLAGMSLNISTLSKDIDSLPLETPDPKSMAQQQKSIDSETARVKTWSGLPAAIWHDVQHLIVIRDHSKPVEPLLAPDQRFFLTENLRLQLEQARLAMLSGNAAVYKERINKALEWVKRYFDPTSPHTVATLAALEKLRDSNIAPALPDISKPYQMLERYRQQSATPESKTESKPK